MKHPDSFTCLVFLLIVMTVPFAGPALAVETQDKTLSPYFFVQSEDPELDRLPLKSTSVAVEIAGVIADVTVTQVYKNEGTRPLEAVYIFPGSTRAAVYGMKMTIGERTINAKVRTREEARREYEQAKQDVYRRFISRKHQNSVQETVDARTIFKAIN